MRLLLLTLSGFFLLMLISCSDDDCIEGDGSSVTRTLNIQDFSEIRLNGSMNVTISQGAEQEVVAVGDGNIISLLTTEVVDGFWDVGFNTECVQNFQLSLIVTVPVIERAEISGSGNIVINDFDQEASLSLGISGSGSATVGTIGTIPTLTSSTSGSGNVTFNGASSVQNLRVDIAGAGSFSGFDVASTNCIVNIAGSGDVEVSVSESLTGAIAGSGSIFYKGNPDIDVSISGSGRIVDSN